jgi:hypothetical protein
MNHPDVSKAAGIGHNWRLVAPVLTVVTVSLLPVVYLVRADQLWGTNVRVDDAPGSASAWHPSIAADPSGNAYAVWQDYRNGNSDIYFSYRLAGGNWQANVRVDNAPGSTAAFYPVIAVDPSDNAYVVWEDYRNGNSDIYFSYRPVGGSWQANVRVDDASGSTESRWPSIAVDLSGNAYVVWYDNRNGNNDVYFSYRPAGGSWQANVRVDDAPDSTNVETPSIAVAPSGNAYVVWSDSRNGNYDIYFSYRPAGGSWQTNVRVDNAHGSTMAWHPSIAVDSSGNAYAVWQDYRNGNDIYFSYRPAGGSWQANARVNNASGSIGASHPSIAVDLSGNAYAMWSDDRNGNNDVYFSYRPVGGSWQANQRVDDAPGLTGAYVPSIAVNPSGSAYAVWQDYRNGNDDIYYSNTYYILTPTAYLPVVLKNFFCDPYEPNDRLSTAWGPLVSGQTINAQICLGDSRDLYYLNATEKLLVTIDLTNMASNTNFDLYLWNSDGDTILARSEKGPGQDERIVYSLPETGLYYVDVYPWSGSGPYTLQVSW